MRPLPSSSAASGEEQGEEADLGEEGGEGGEK